MRPVSSASEEQIEKSRAFFNRERPATVGQAPAPVFEHVFAATRELVPRGESGQTAVDLGCHWGRYTAVLAESFGRVIGVDFAEQALRTAETRPNISYHRLDLDQEGDGLRQFQPIDFFLAIAVFEMLRTPAELLRNMYSSGADDCRALVLVPNRHSLNYLSLRAALWFGRHFRGRDRDIYNNRITRQQLREYVRAAGFEVESEGAIVGVPVYIVSTLPHFLQRALIAIDAVLMRLLGGSYHWIYCKKIRAAGIAAPAGRGDACKSS